MKRAFITTAILLFLAALFYANGHYGLLSMAGLNAKGLAIKEVKGSLVSIQQTSAIRIDHAQWTELLRKYVKEDGTVDYKGFLKDKEQLHTYLNILSAHVPTNDWSVQEQLAYYINLYNAHTVNLILENYPIKSIKDIEGAWTKDIVKIGDEQISLGGLEHGILRKMNEPRIHFAINCASASCPDLLNEAFAPKELNQQLEKVTLAFINSDKNAITQEEVALSRIFKWYKSDFDDGDPVGYINKYSKVKIRPETKIGYKRYDWSLNEQN